MVEIENGLGKKSFGSSNMRSFVVPDESEAIEPQPRPVRVDPQEAMARRRQFASGSLPEAPRNAPVPMERSADADPDVRRRVELLVGLGRAQEDVEVVLDGKKAVFTLRTLKGREQQEVHNLIESAPRVNMADGKSSISATAMYDLRIIALKYSIFAVDGIELDFILGTAGYPQDMRIQERAKFVEELDNELTQYLFYHFNNLVTKNNRRYPFPQNQAQMKEVAEQVYKSSSAS